MRNSKLFLVVLIAIIAIVAGIIVTRSSQSQSRNVQQQKKVEDDTPIVDFNASKPVNSQENEIRTKRGRKYKTSIALDKTEDESVVFENLSSNAAVELAFPVEQSDVIIIGTVTDSQAFISNDKTAVYSEFQVTVDQILKNDKDLSVSPESNVIAERIGGKVRFPSGKIQKRGETGHNLLQKNKQYVLFLKWDKEGKDYSILTGYEVNGQIVNPLDGLGNDNSRIFGNYNLYKNADLTDFLLKLQAAIANQSLGEK